jgi:hypothetical protein
MRNKTDSAKEKGVRVLRSSIAALLVLATPAIAQTVLPNIDVTAPRWQERRGGYVVSSNFALEPKLSAVVFPNEPLQQDDIVYVKPQNMKDDEYFVLQECSSPDCAMGHVLSVWNKNGALGTTYHDLNRVPIPHEGKFFFWMQRFPAPGGVHAFSGFEAFSPPLVLKPTGSAEQFQVIDVKAAQEKGPEKVVETKHDGMDYLIRYESGTVACTRPRKND